MYQQYWNLLILANWVQAYSTSKHTGSFGRIIRSGIWAMNILRARVGVCILGVHKMWGGPRSFQFFIFFHIFSFVPNPPETCSEVQSKLSSWRQVIQTCRISPCHWWTWGWIPCRLWSSGIVCRSAAVQVEFLTFLDVHVGSELLMEEILHLGMVEKCWTPIDSIDHGMFTTYQLLQDFFHFLPFTVGQ